MNDDVAEERERARSRDAREAPHGTHARRAHSSLAAADGGSLHAAGVRQPRTPLHDRLLTPPAAAQIFNRQGASLYYREYSRPKAIKDLNEEHKLMFGFLFSLKQLVGKMSPKKCAHTRPHTRRATLVLVGHTLLRLRLPQERRLLFMQHEHVPDTLF